jgi:hypothetical protein
MNQQQILGELMAMRRRFEYYERVNTVSKDGKMAAGAAYAYGVAARNINRLFSKVLAEGVEIEGEVDE